MPGKPDQIKEIEVTRGFWSRCRGWRTRKPHPGTALLIYPASCAHTFFMQAAIDIAFLDQEGRVLSVVEGLAPWRVSPRVRQAAAVMEMPERGAQRAGIREGEFLPSPLAELVRGLIG